MEEIQEQLHQRLEEAERRLWMRVIIEAVNDLDSKEIEILRDHNDEPVLSESGNIIRYSVSKDAHEFLSGQNRMLYKIAKRADLNATAITEALKKLGPEKLKQHFVDYLKEREA